jgi:hypothetical protein
MHFLASKDACISAWQAGARRRAARNSATANRQQPRNRGALRCKSPAPQSQNCRSWSWLRGLNDESHDHDHHNCSCRERAPSTGRGRASDPGHAAQLGARGRGGRAPIILDQVAPAAHLQRGAAAAAGRACTRPPPWQRAAAPAAPGSARRAAGPANGAAPVLGTQPGQQPSPRHHQPCSAAPAGCGTPCGRRPRPRCTRGQ